MDPRYIKIGSADDKVVEECAEVIQALIKIKRFGLMSSHPARPQSSNKDEVIAEIADLRLALENYLESLGEPPEAGRLQVGWCWVEGVSTDGYTCKFQPFEPHGNAGMDRKDTQFYIDHKWAPMFIARQAAAPALQDGKAGA